MTNSEYLFKAALKAKKPIFFSFQTSPSAEWWGLERATGAYLGGFYEIFQNDLILLWALLMNGNPIWPQYLGTQSQCWERLTPPTLSKPLPPWRRTCRVQGSSGEPLRWGAWQSPVTPRAECPTTCFPRATPTESWDEGWLGASVGRMRGKGKLTCYIFRQASRMWMRPRKERQEGRNIAILSEGAPVLFCHQPPRAARAVGAGIIGLWWGRRKVPELERGTIGKGLGRLGTWNSDFS